MGRQVVAATIALLVLGACGGGGSSTVTARGAVKFSEEMSGGMVLGNPTIGYPDGSKTEECEGANEVDDLVSGAQVVVRNADDRIVGTGELATGITRFTDSSTGETVRGVPQSTLEETRADSGTITCLMAFRIPKVDDSDFYTVKVASQEPVTVKRERLKSLILTVG